MDSDTDLGGAAVAFPLTRCSLVRATGSTDPAERQRAFDGLIGAYWKPVYKYLRTHRHCNNEDAKDLTQAFFTRALEKDFFEQFDPARARFRTFLRVCLDRFVCNADRAAARLKRGGHVRVVSLDFEAADDELRRQGFPAAADPDAFFRQEWLRSLFGVAVEDVRRACVAAGKETHFALFQRYDLHEPDTSERPTYDQLAREFDLSATQVTNHLAFVRRQFRGLVLDRLRAGTGSDEEFAQECRRLFGGDAR